MQNKNKSNKTKMALKNCHISLNEYFTLFKIELFLQEAYKFVHWLMIFSYITFLNYLIIASHVDWNFCDHFQVNMFFRKCCFLLRISIYFVNFLEIIKTPTIKLFIHFLCRINLFNLLLNPSNIDACWLLFKFESIICIIH